MSFTVCPAAVVAAPIESVWELLSEPTLRDEWWDARTRRVVPEGKASPGQVIYLKTFPLVRKWDATISVERLDHEEHEGNRRRMSQCDRDQRDQHDLPALPIEAERHGKQPAHGRIEPVKRAERDQEQPWGEIGHCAAFVIARLDGAIQ